MEISRVMSEAEEFSKMVFSQRNILSAMKADFDKQQEHIVKLHSGIESLYETQFKILDNICYQYFENQESDKIKHLLYIEVLKNIEIMRSPEYVKKLETLVDNYRCNVILKLRSQFPAMKEEDIRFLIYLFAGLSLRSICLLMNFTIGNYYNKRTRLKAKIADSNADDKELFLSMFCK